MKKQLTSAEIKTLYKFCRIKGVKEYEIQTELVDHLASSIENIWQHRDDINFFDALTKTQSDFGAGSFESIVEEKRRIFRHKYNLLFCKFLMSFFLLPKIIITFAMMMILFILFHHFNIREFILISTGSISVFCAIWFLFFYYPKQFYLIKNGNSFLLVNYFKKLGVVSYLVAICFQFVIRYFASYQSEWLNLIFSFLIVFILISEYALIFYIHGRLKADFTRMYPQFVKS